MHEVAIVVLPDVSPLDLGIACDAFGHLRGSDGLPLYGVRTCGEGPPIPTGAFTITPSDSLDALEIANTVLVPGSWRINLPPSNAVCEALRKAHRRGARIASICTGAFALAAAGLLDGRRATTHWMAADELAQRYPSTIVDRNVLFADEASVITSAGASAGMDMCLHLIARDHGQAVAAHAARMAVAPLHREGGQAQFIPQSMPLPDASLAPLLEWMTENINAELSVEAMAFKAGLSPRTLARRFHQQVGTTPFQWLLTARVRRAQALLESTTLSLSEVATACGFESLVTLRARFARVVGLGPAAYRRQFAMAQTQRAG